MVDRPRATEEVLPQAADLRQGHVQVVSRPHVPARPQSHK